MDPNRQLRQALNSGLRTEQVLERYYGQLVQWGSFLMKGDQDKARDLVHDFYLYFTLTRPDLSHVENLNGYLYRSLRHIYLSNLARSSRDALHFVSIADLDSVRLALPPFQAGESLQRQNDLRKACCYAVWRKDQTKSASYFILRFFHGYHHREIADLARMPLATVFTKFGLFRIEAKNHLEDPGKVQFLNRELPPKPVLQRTPVSSFDLFNELRSTILDARTGRCLPEDELLEPYRSANPARISCSLLSHIVSCERCLALIDRHLRRPTLHDREPFDHNGGHSGRTGGSGSGPSTTLSHSRLLRSVQGLQVEAFEHRPSSLSIALDGRIVASNVVVAHRSGLSLRVENPENTRFVEVFSDQGFRLALASIEQALPDGPAAVSQCLSLSDDRHLDLNLTFDGLGLNIEVVYFDPVMMTNPADEDDAAESLDVISGNDSSNEASGGIDHKSWSAKCRALILRPLWPLTISPVLNWSVAIACIACLVGYVALHQSNNRHALSAVEILNRSVEAESSGLLGQTEHQVFGYEETAEGGSVIAQGTIDLWRDGDGKRYIRRLYDSRRHLIAVEARRSDGTQQDEYPKGSDTQISDTDRELLADSLWKLEVSSSAFRVLSNEKSAVHSTADGYELTAAEPDASRSHILSATLVLDRRLHPVGESLRWRREGRVREVRFTQVDYERRPSPSVPDATFMVLDQSQHAQVQRRTITKPVITSPAGTDAQLTELQIAVLYQLSSLDADSHEMIDVRETAARRILAAGSVADDRRKQEILARLNQLENHQLLDLEIVSPQDPPQRNAELPQTPVAAITTYSAQDAGSPAKTALRAFFQARGLSRKAADAAATEFTRKTLQHSLRALREAGVLKRLGDDFPAARLHAVNVAQRQQWTEMVAHHASALESELRSLHEQLTPLVLTGQAPPEAFDESTIETSEQFAGRTDELFAITKSMHESLADIFTSNELVDLPAANIDSSINSAYNAIPLRNAAQMSHFAARLNASAGVALSDQQQSRSDFLSPNRP